MKPIPEELAEMIANSPMHFRGEPFIPVVEFTTAPVLGEALPIADPYEALQWLRDNPCRVIWWSAPGTYTGPNVKLGDYYVREHYRTGTEHRQVVHFEVVGTGRYESMARSRFDRQARAA